MLLTLVLFTLLAPTPSGAIENQPSFKKACAKAWMASQLGAAPKEVEFTINTRNQVSEFTMLNGFSDRRAGGAIRIPIDAFAVIHTHPNIGDDRPSAIDVRTAQEQGLPIYVVSRSGLWLTQNGEIYHVFDAKWLK